MKIFSFIGSCPECGANSARVVLTKKTKDLKIVRRRACHECGHRWYTLQYPEIEISPNDVSWENCGGNCVYNPKHSIVS